MSWYVGKHRVYSGYRWAIMADQSGHAWDLAHVCNGADADMNAAMIAAAPDMFIALRELLFVHDMDKHRKRKVMPCDTPLSRMAIDMARAAVAKANNITVSN